MPESALARFIRAPLAERESVYRAVMAAASAMQAASAEKIGARVLRRPVGPSPARERTPTRERDTMPVIPVAGVIVLAMCLLAAYRAGGRG